MAIAPNKDYLLEFEEELKYKRKEFLISLPEYIYYRLFACGCLGGHNVALVSAFTTPSVDMRRLLSLIIRFLPNGQTCAGAGVSSRFATVDHVTMSRRQANHAQLIHYYILLKRFETLLCNFVLFASYKIEESQRGSVLFLRFSGFFF